MKNKFRVLLAFSLFILPITLSSCSNIQLNSEKEDSSVFDATYHIYLLAIESGFNGTYEEWIKTLKGDKGDAGNKGEPGNNGLNGIDGKTPYIGENGHWWIGDIDTNVFAEGIKGDKGDSGDKGEPGSDGKDGVDGKSAYKLYIESHPEYTGSEEQWLEDLINGNLGNKIVHTVSFDSNGGTYVADQIVYHGEKAIKPKVSKYGYTLDGWYIDQEKWNFHGFSVTYDVVLTAKWIEKESDIFVFNIDNAYLEDQITYCNGDEETRFQYSKAEQYVDGHVKFLKNGLLTNTSPISSIKNIKVDFEKVEAESKLLLYFDDYALPYSNEQELISGSLVNLEGAQYFVIQAQNSEIRINRIEINYEYTKEILEKNIPKIFIETEKKENGDYIIPVDKINYVNSKIYLVDDDNPKFNLGTRNKPLKAEIKLRGNSTMTKPKKPYRIKFDKKQSVFGEPSNKSWALLADYMDASALHNFSALRYASKLDGFDFSSSANHVELILNNESQGLYLMTDHIQTGKNRINIEMNIEETTKLEDVNYYIELDKSAIYDATEILDVTYFKYSFSEDVDYYYTLKYPELDDFPSEEKYFEFFEYIKQEVDNIWTLFKETDSVAFNNKIDINSILDYLMTDFVFQEQDHSQKSFKMFYNASAGKLFFGPPWDYDSCSFSLPYKGEPIDDPREESASNPFSRKGISNKYLYYFYHNHGGKELLYERYNLIGKSNLENLANVVNKQYSNISGLLISDANIWYEGDLSIVFENVKYVVDFLIERKLFLDGYFA